MRAGARNQGLESACRKGDLSSLLAKERRKAIGPWLCLLQLGRRSQQKSLRAIESEEPVLIEELRRRYLLPWCRFARQRLAQEESRLGFLPERFEADLLAVDASAR